MFALAPDQPMCKYGTGCYRQNPQHWKDFNHPADHRFISGEPSAKKQRTEATSASSASSVSVSATAIASSASSSSSSASSATASASTTASSGKQAVLVFAPGAGGATAQAMRLFQDREMSAAGLRVVRCDDEPLTGSEKRWFTGNAANAGNLDHVVAVATRAAAAHPGLPIFLCGASFGNRVLAEVLRLRRAELPAAVDKDALICMGYPLHKVGKPEGDDPRRAAHLTQLPASVHTLFVQGDQDEFLLARGLDALREVMDRMAGTTTLHAVPGGEHILPKAKGLKALGVTQPQVNQRIVEALGAFVDARTFSAAMALWNQTVQSTVRFSVGGVLARRPRGRDASRAREM